MPDESSLSRLNATHLNSKVADAKQFTNPGAQLLAIQQTHEKQTRRKKSYKPVGKVPQKNARDVTTHTTREKGDSKMQNAKTSWQKGDRAHAVYALATTSMLIDSIQRQPG